MQYYNSTEWKEFLRVSTENLINAQSFPFRNVTLSKLPTSSGIYLITEVIDEVEVALYVGRAINLGRRIYTNHLMGNLSTARLKKYLTEDPGHHCFGESRLAKRHLIERCSVRWILEQDFRRRGALEGYFTAVLFPNYGISREH
jgi:hypothetical protein